MKIEVKDKFISENKELINKIALKASDIHDKECNQNMMAILIHYTLIW